MPTGLILAFFASYTWAAYTVEGHYLTWPLLVLTTAEVLKLLTFKTKWVEAILWVVS